MAKPKKTTKTGAARKRAAPDLSLSGALAGAAWAEADLALAEALADLDAVQAATSNAARDDALDHMAQSLTRAARRRGLTRIGACDAEEAYDSARHDLNAPVAKPPKTVRIETRGVARGAEILVKPRVAPVERKKRP